MLFTIKSLLNHLSDATSSHRSAHHVLSRNLSHMPPPDSCPSRSQIRSSGELRNFRGFYGRCFDGKIIQLNGGPMPLPPNELLCGKAYTINHPEVRFIRLLPWKVTLIGSAAKPFWGECQGAMFWVESLCYVRRGYQDSFFFKIYRYK